MTVGVIPGILVIEEIQLVSTTLPDAYIKVTCKYFLDYFRFQNASFETILLT
jgi:hypothetical protein